MYQKHDKSTVYEVNGLDCYKPPKGMVYNNSTHKFEHRGVARRSSHRLHQFWERPLPPEDFLERRKKEILKQKSEPQFVDLKLQAYRNQEWDRRLNGFWFSNNGEATYITGLHYFYLTHWRLDTGYPDFRIPDMEFFYFLEYCIQDPDCLGMIELTKRRQGKTVRAGAFLYDYTSRAKNIYAGIQSKTLEDSKNNVFAKGVVSAFKQLPDFFIPVYDTEKGVTPKSELRFFKPNKRGRNVEMYDPGAELESKDVDVYERHQVVQFCLQLDGAIIGKALYTTTVEEMEQGGEDFKRLWDASDHTQKNKNNRTVSGLYRYFLPAYRTLYYDKYGYPDENKGQEFYENERKSLESDPRALASYIRKNPFSIEEAFWVEGESCLFDAMKLNKQLENITWRGKGELYQQGELLWKGAEKDSIVIFAPKVNGRFLISNKIDVSLHGNAVQTRGTKKYPLNKTKFVAGADPFDHNIVAQGSRMSDGAGYVYAKFDAASNISETFVCEYLYRPQTSDMYYEDMIKMCVFFGCEILSENNKIGLIKYFESRGYEKFLMKLPNARTYGVPANSKTHQQMVEELEVYVYENCEKIIYKTLLEDLLKFDINNTTKFDAAMAAGWTLVGAGKKKIINKVEDKRIYDIREIFPM